LSGATTFLTGIGLRPLFIRALARSTGAEERRRLIRAQLALRLLFALVAGAIAIGAAWALHHPPIILSCVAIAAAGIVPAVVWTTFGDVLNAEEAFRDSALATLISGIALTTATVVAVVAGLGPVGVAWAYFLGPLLTAVQLSGAMRRRGLPVLPGWDPAEMRRLVREARLTAAGDGIGVLVTRLRDVYIPVLVSPAIYGLYVTGQLLVSRLNIVGDALITAYAPGLARDHAVLRAGRPSWASQTVMRLLMLSGILLAVGSLAVAAWFTGVVYRGPNEAAARHAALLVMVITSLSLPLATLQMGWRQLLIAVDEHDLAARCAGVASLLGGVVTFGLTWADGVRGAAIGVVAAALVAAVLTGRAAWRVMGQAAAVPAAGAGLLSLLAGGGLALAGVRLGISISGALLVVLAPLVTAGLLILLGAITREELAEVGRRLGRRSSR
jgi:O-antigen/teichoic acid export membrane protein